MMSLSVRCASGEEIAVESQGGWERLPARSSCWDRGQGRLRSEPTIRFMRRILRCYTITRTLIRSPFRHETLIE